MSGCPVHDPRFSADTAADPHRWFCEPYCKQHGFDECSCNPDGFTPGLHTRCPETRVEGLAWIEAGGYWATTITIKRAFELLPALAADLLVMGVVKDLIARKSLLYHFWIDVVRIMEEQSATLPEAVAIARHRAKDSEDAR